MAELLVEQFVWEGTYGLDESIDPSLDTVPLIVQKQIRHGLSFIHP
jgi:hypothetical protein